MRSFRTATVKVTGSDEIGIMLGKNKSPSQGDGLKEYQE
jgi:hypothetical protein